LLKFLLSGLENETKNVAREIRAHLIKVLGEGEL